MHPSKALLKFFCVNVVQVFDVVVL